jgi:hypothetical protein
VSSEKGLVKLKSLFVECVNISVGDSQHACMRAHVSCFLRSEDTVPLSRRRGVVVVGGGDGRRTFV